MEPKDQSGNSIKVEEEKEKARARAERKPP